MNRKRVEIFKSIYRNRLINLKKYDEKDLASKIKDGFPQTLMPKYDFLSLYELHQIARYLKSPL